MRVALSLCAVVMLVASCTVGTPVGDPMAPDQPSRGHLVLNGGGSKPAVVMEKFIELAGGRDAEIVVFPTASELEDTGEYYRSSSQTSTVAPMSGRPR